MNTEERIIALLHGEMTDEVEALKLMHTLIVSPDDCRLLIQHARLARQLPRMGEKIAPPESISAAALDLIALESKGLRGTGVITSFRRTLREKMSAAWIGLFALGLLSGLLLPSPIRSNENGGTSLKQREEAQRTDRQSAAVPKAGQEVEDSFAVVDSTSTSDTSSPIWQPPNGLQREGRPTTIPSVHQPIEDSPMNIRQGLATAAATAIASTASLLGQVQVIAPNGGERFSAGDIIPIVWSGVPHGEAATVEFSPDRGRSWRVIADSAAGGYMKWQVPGIPATTQCLVRVRTNRGGESELELFKSLGRGTMDVAWAEFNPSGSIVAAGTRGNKIILWDTKNWSQIRTIETPDGITMQVKFSPDGKKFVTVSLDGRVRLWNTGTGAEESMLDPHLNTAARFAAFSPDGSRIAVGHDNGTVVLWDASLRQRLATFQTCNGAIRYLEYSSDGTKIGVASADRMGRTIDATTGILLRTFLHQPEDRQSSIVNAISISPDGSTIATGGFDGVLKLWDASTGGLRTLLQPHGGERISKVHFSWDGRWIISVGYDGRGVFIDPGSGNVVAQADAGYGVTYTASFSSDMRLLALGHGPDGLTIWKLPTGSEGDVSNGRWSISRCDDTQNIEDEELKNQMDLD